MIFIEVPVGEPARQVNLHPSALSTILGTVSFAYPLEDPGIGLAHDDNGIANGRRPNRTVGSEIIPGPFYMVRINSEGDLIDLTPDDVEKYTRQFAVPESFPPGEWKIHTRVSETRNTCFIHLISEWVATPDEKEELG